MHRLQRPGKAIKRLIHFVDAILPLSFSWSYKFSRSAEGTHQANLHFLKYILKCIIQELYQSLNYKGKSRNLKIKFYYKIGDIASYQSLYLLNYGKTVQL